jgi:hypothetical protein
MTPSATAAAKRRQELYDSLITEGNVRSLLGGRTFDQYLTHLATLTPTPEPEHHNTHPAIPGL